MIGRICFVLAALLYAFPAHAGVQASGANLILPSDSSLVIDQQITMSVRIRNTSSNTNPPNEDAVPAVLLGTTRVKLACANSTCATELPGTLQFVTCDNLAAGVASCALDAGDPTNNTVAITMTAGGVAIAANAMVTLARITVKAINPIVSPANGAFNTRVSTGNNDLRACEQPAGTPCATGGAQGSAVLFFPVACGDGFVNQAFETCDTNPLGQVPGAGQCCPFPRVDGNPNPCGDPPGDQVGCPDNGQTCRDNASEDPCTLCGDGIVQVSSGEVCDDGNDVDTDSCTNSCATTTTSTSTSTSSSTSTSTSTSSTSTSTSTSTSSSSTSSSSSSTSTSTSTSSSSSSSSTSTSTSSSSTSSSSTSTSTSTTTSTSSTSSTTSTTLPCLCLLVCDEEFIDNDMRSVEQAADRCGEEPDVLVNDDRPTETGNPPLVWNTDCAPDQTRLPTGQVDDEGCFMLPLEGATIDYADSTFNATCPRTTGVWTDMFVAGTLPQRCLDKVRNVMPIRNQDWAKLIGQSCVVVQYDSDISMNYKPITANLQGARYGLFFMTIDDVVLPGTLPESGSSTTLYDLDITVNPDPSEFDVCLDTFGIRVRDHEPDSCQLTTARCRNGVLEVRATNDYGKKTLAGEPTQMTVSIDGFLLEEPMTFQANRWVLSPAPSCLNNSLVGRRISVQTNAGCAYNGTIE